MDEEAEKLLLVLKSNAMETDGEPFLMRYNHTWTLPFLRRNEVAVNVKMQSRSREIVQSMDRHLYDIHLGTEREDLQRICIPGPGSARYAKG